MHKRNGFTIVEVLIAIVVIAILASVSVVGYNGIQQRAANSAVLVTVDSAEEALGLHYTFKRTPLKAASPGWYHESIATMAGVCLAKDWPSVSKMGESVLVGGHAEDEVRSLYCGWHGHTSITVQEAQQRLDANVAASPTRESFSNIPSFPPITLDVTGGNSYTIRGIRYAFNNSPTNPISYLYYPLYGKKCAPGDASIRLTDTFWPSSGDTVWTGSFVTGGDYTTNNTVSCVRTIKYK